MERPVPKLVRASTGALAAVENIWFGLNDEVRNTPGGACLDLFISRLQLAISVKIPSAFSGFTLLQFSSYREKKNSFSNLKQ